MNLSGQFSGQPFLPDAPNEKEGARGSADLDFWGRQKLFLLSGIGLEFTYNPARYLVSFKICMLSYVGSFGHCWNSKLLYSFKYLSSLRLHATTYFRDCIWHPYTVKI
jgi:hypothetical protein